MTGTPKPGLVFYGDDFTGSTDALEVLAAAGIPSVLLLREPDQALRARVAGARAIGLAGISRSKPPGWMDRNLPRLFAALASFEAPLLHYKTCSTFDSSPQIGNIGRAIEIGLEQFGNHWVPLLAGAPALGRYTLFGNHFAAAAGTVWRLDRHPTMSCHPVTPMTEADLLRHLAAQTARPIGLVDILAIESGKAKPRLAELVAAGAEIVLFDVLDEHSLADIGGLIPAGNGRPQFVAGSSGVEYALVAHWRATRRLGSPPPAAEIAPSERLLVVSGSCSPVTAAQIAAARAGGFAVERLELSRLLDAATRKAEEERVHAIATRALRAGRSVVLHSAEGPADPAIGELRARIAGSAHDGSLLSERLGESLARLAGALVRENRLKRLVVAGGDTSGYCARGLGLAALTMIAPAAPGSPLCRAVAEDPALDGLEVAFKGGQIGSDAFFIELRDGIERQPTLSVMAGDHR